MVKDLCWPMGASWRQVVPAGPPVFYCGAAAAFPAPVRPHAAGIEHATYQPSVSCAYSRVGYRVCDMTA